jgi:predicted dehydrogenase
MNEIGWGILGPGNIAAQFAKGLAHVPGAKLRAVGSRSEAKAQEFASRFGADTGHGSYEALVADPTVDVVYIATPHMRHKDDMLLALNAGKAVLCEKPFTINAADAREVFALAREKELFCMEAMWTRFMPLWSRVRALVESGGLGELRYVQGSFGFEAPGAAEGRFFNPALAGGALLDIGLYPISLAHSLLGKPVSATGQLSLGETGVDEQCAATLRFNGGAIANIAASLRAPLPNDFTIVGSTGMLELHAPIYCPLGATLRRIGQTPHTGLLARVLRKAGFSKPPGEPWRSGLTGNGYNYEAVEVGRCLAAGELESSVMSQGHTVEVLEILDDLRAQGGLRYPMES